MKKNELVEALLKVRETESTLTAGDAAPLAISPRGLEAVIVGGYLGVEKTDWVFPGIRERAGAVLRNCPEDRLLDAQAGARPYRIAPTTTSPGARMLHACGMAMAKGEGSTVLCFIGQGSAATGEFHEALNLAALHNLHVIFLVHCWDLTGDDSPLAPQMAGTISSKALAYGIHSSSVDGGSVTDVLEAVANAKAHGGPQLIEAHLKRGEDPVKRGEEELGSLPPVASNAAIAS